FYVEEGQRWIKSFVLCQLCLYPVGEVLWHLNITSSNSDLCCGGGVGHDLPPCDRGVKHLGPLGPDVLTSSKQFLLCVTTPILAVVITYVAKHRQKLIRRLFLPPLHAALLPWLRAWILWSSHQQSALPALSGRGHTIRRCAAYCPGVLLPTASIDQRLLEKSAHIGGRPFL